MRHRARGTVSHAVELGNWNMNDMADLGRPERLRFGYAETALGTVSAAESATGLTALLLGDDRERLRENWTVRFQARNWSRIRRACRTR